MIISSHGTPEFWQFYRALPAEVRILARKNYPSLVGQCFSSFAALQADWQAQLVSSGGDHYRAVGKFAGSVFLWEWIGTHEDYNKRF